MVKKLIILVLIVWLVFMFYKKFLADTLGPFFRQHKDNVDMYGTSIPDKRIKPKGVQNY